MITTEILNRKGAIKSDLIPNDVIDLLNQGKIESVNLTEWLNVDQNILLKKVLAESGKENYLQDCKKELSTLKTRSMVQCIACIGTNLLKQSKQIGDKDLFKHLADHKSDSVRCWALYFIGADTTLSLKDKLNGIKQFAADSHFGVREIAWMAIRQDIIDNLEESISILSEWTSDRDPNIRRFASESTRPRGVWCKHIEALKMKPEMAVSILRPLRSDSNKYVQDSVANWINDASKTNPQWVEMLCKNWLKESPTKETQYIVKRALRSINKK
ncbi:MAG: DNA alkylation repair protein [Dysgonomonas sp.]